MEIGSASAWPSCCTTVDGNGAGDVGRWRAGTHRALCNDAPGSWRPAALVWPHHVLAINIVNRISYGWLCKITTELDIHEHAKDLYICVSVCECGLK